MAVIELKAKFEGKSFGKKPMSRYGQIVNGPTVAENPTPQTETFGQQSPVFNKTQVENNAGGYVFQLDKWSRLDRFLILGAEGNTYYCTERKMVKDNATNLKACLAEDGLRFVRRVVEISEAGRAPKNDPAIFALALACGSTDGVTERLALSSIPKVCRTGTHLFHFIADVENFRKWGRSLRTAVSNWYTCKSDRELALQALKYQSRDGWSHRDVLRLCHAKPSNPVQDASFKWMTSKDRSESKDGLHELLVAFNRLQVTQDRKEVLRLLEEYQLPREALPTEWLNDPTIWATLLPHMGTTAMIRNLGKMTSVGLLAPLSDETRHVVKCLQDPERIAKDRMHPIQYLLASGVYGQGHGVKGKLTWSPVRNIVDALDEGFYKSFGNVKASGKSTLLCLDVSGSMSGGLIAGAPGITPAKASAAMAMVTARTEESWALMAFNNGLQTLDISPKESLAEVVRKTANINFGGTDCSLPMVFAKQNKLPVDTFVVYTDSETYSGRVHPFQALNDYRQSSGRDAKLVVVGMTATDFTIADPSDKGMLDIVGFDTYAPTLISDFSSGKV